MNVLWTFGELVSAYAHINSLGCRREANAPLSLARRLMELLISCLDKTFSLGLRLQRCSRNALLQSFLELQEQIGKNVYRKQWALRIRQTQRVGRLGVVGTVDLQANRFVRKESPVLVDANQFQ